VALTHDGEAYAWGSNKFGQCGSDVQSSIVLHDPLKVDFEEYYKPFLRQVNAGGSHTLVSWVSTVSSAITLP
jgi:alpha-tubulin suppressor-like RCC1 family protein